MVAENAGLIVGQEIPGHDLGMSTPATYRIVVRGDIDSYQLRRLNGMHIVDHATARDIGDTVIEGRLPDQAALSGVLNSLYEMRLPVVSADCIKTASRKSIQQHSQKNSA